MHFCHRLPQFFEHILRGSRNDLHLGDITWTKPWAASIYISFENDASHYKEEFLWQQQSVDLLQPISRSRVDTKSNCICGLWIVHGMTQYWCWSLTKPDTKFGYNVSCGNKERREANLFNFDRRSSMAPARRPSVAACLSCKLLNIYTFRTKCWIPTSFLSSFETTERPAPQAWNIWLKNRC